MLLTIYYILLYYTSSKYLWVIQFIRSKTIEPMVQLVLNGCTSKPLNPKPCGSISGPGSAADALSRCDALSMSVILIKYLCKHHGHEVFCN